VKIVLSNAAPAEAERLARVLVTERLAACVNLLPVRSVYRWDGELQMDTEVTLVIKVSDTRVSALCERLRELHSYTLPEIITLDVDTASSHAPYLDWVHRECSPEPGTEADPRG
jgi:periplasmic divalent cation tolerance protein